MSIRIGISGKMCSGKSLVARYLTDKYNFIEMSFASRLKELALELFDVKQKDERGRFILQQLANHLREIDPAVWLRYLVARIPIDCNIVISDVRYPNEYQTLKSLGFSLVRMQMSRKEQERLVEENYPDIPLILLDDYSETALDEQAFEFSIRNDWDVALEAVYGQVDALIGTLFFRQANANER